MDKKDKLTASSIVFIIAVGCFLGGLAIGLYNKSDIVSTTPIEPYKVVTTKENSKLVRTFYYKQQ